MDYPSGHQEVESKRQKRRWFSLLLKTGLVTLVGIFMLLLVVQVVLDRTWGKERVSKILSDNLNTEVTMTEFNINIFRSISLDEILIRDHKMDTLIYADRLSTDISSIWLGLLSRKLLIKDVSVEGGRVNLIRYKGDERNNMSMTFNPNPDPNAPPDTTQPVLALSLDEISLTDVSFSNHDYNRGREETYTIPEGSIEVDHFGLSDDSLSFSLINLFCPEINIHLFDPEIKETQTDVVIQDTSWIEESVSREKRPFFMGVDKIHISGGVFQLDNFVRTPEWNRNYDRIDYDHFLLNDVNIDVDDYRMRDMAFAGNHFSMSFESPSGFSLQSLTATEVVVDSSQMTLNGLRLFTPYSSLGDTLVFNYRCYESWRDFNNQIFIQADLHESFIAFRDIMSFAPKLYDNTFFINSENQIVQLDGKIFGRINSLKAQGIDLKVDDDIRLVGSISTRDLAVRDQELVSMDIEQLKFDIQALENIIPNLDIPNNFEKLGDLRYSGRFDGYFLDFVTFGELYSNLGKASLDMRLDLKGGSENAAYSGKLSLQDFDLRSWTNQPDFGVLSMNMEVKEGLGLTLNNANAILEGNIGLIEFKNYQYRDLQIDGRLNKNLFDGELISDSEDARFSFNGRISGLDSVPEYRFDANFEQVRLEELMLTKQRFDFGGHTSISLTGLNWDELIGHASLEDTWIVVDDQDTLSLSRMNLEQRSLGAARKLALSSVFGKIEIEGVYDIPSIHVDLLSLVDQYHPQISSLIGIDTVDRAEDQLRDYSIGIDLNESFDLINYLTKDRYRISTLFLDAHVNMLNGGFRCVTEIPDLGIKNWDIVNARATIMNEDELLVYDAVADHIYINDKPWFDSVQHVANFIGDAGEINLSYVDPQYIFESVDISADMTPENDQLQFSFKPSSLWFKNEEWKFIANNSLKIGKDGLYFNNFQIYSNNSSLVLDDINEGKGVKASLNRLSSDVIDSLIHLKSFDFSGRFNASVSVGTLDEIQDVEVEVVQDSTFINDVYRGFLRAKIQGHSLEEGLAAELHLADLETSLYARGTVRDSSEELPVKYDFNVSARKMPLILLEDIIRSGISDTKGQATGSLIVDGLGKDFEIVGELVIRNGKTKIDYTGVDYYFDDQTVLFDGDYIDLTGAILRDSLGNVAYVDGGLGHTSFKEWYMDVAINSDRMIGLNTTKADNPDYYGFAIGATQVEFYGTFEQPNIDITAVTSAPTTLVIPLSSGQGRIETGFVSFVKRDTINTDTLREDADRLKGLELDMKLTVTEDAKASIIFDEKAGDKLEGYGRGNMIVRLSRAGEMTVYGDYEIEEGDYLFTLLNFVNKPFIVKRGGTIKWTGDPVDALIDIEAEYKGLTAAPLPLIQEYVVNNEELQSDASRRTRIDLTMGLRGSLLSPLITFKIATPELLGELKTYVDNKLQTLSNDPDQLNQQVFGLVVFGGFIPSETQGALFTFNNIGASTINTLSEFLSSQLSQMVSSLMNNIVDDVKFISGIDVDLAYVQQNANQQSFNDFSSGEYQFRFRNRLWNDQWVITLGGNYGAQTAFASDPYFNPETVIEWNTPVNGLKLRLYYRAEQSFQGQRQKVGGGLRFRKEFDSFSEFLSSAQKNAKPKG